jgi:hypothetical protein
VSDDTAGRLREAGAVSLLRPWLQGRHVMGEAFEGFLVGAPRTATMVEPPILIEKLSEELLCCSFGRGHTTTLTESWSG